MALNHKEIKYSYNDISIVPSIVSNIKHREECEPFINGKLPLFTAPMSSVVSVSNFDVFEKNYINAILPRTEPIDARLYYSNNGKWAAFGLNEFYDNFIENKQSSTKLRVLIDVANGHMKQLLEMVKTFKEKYKDIDNEIMVGNIANPVTYIEMCKYGVDYVRCGVGGGEGCITSSNLGVHYPMASLIDEIAKIKVDLGKSGKYSKLTKVIADGGIRNYSDVIKALSLGADYVMIGGLFTRMIESAADTFIYTKNSKKYFLINHYFNETDNGWAVVDKSDENRWAVVYPKLYKSFFGMASKKAQKLMHGQKIRTSEGIEKVVEVKYSLPQWVDNFIDYLRSAMSYTNARTVKEFIENTETIVISNNTYLSVNK